MRRWAGGRDPDLGCPVPSLNRLDLVSERSSLGLSHHHDTWIKD